MLERFLSLDHTGIEFGCGVSTVWLARRCGRLVSVEHDPEWYAATLGRLRSIEASNVDLRLCPTGAEYVAAAEDPGPFDFALVDGKRRAAVAPRIARSISPGGLLVLDNADRYDGSPEWAPFREVVSDWTCFRTSNGVWRTDLYRRHRAASI